MNLNANDDTDVDEEEIPCPRKRGLNKIYEEFKTYTDLKAATEDLRILGWIKGKRRKEKQLFRCKRGCPKALFCLLTKNGVTAYESTCQHQQKESKYYLPPKAVKVVNECFDCLISVNVGLFK